MRGWRSASFTIAAGFSFSKRLTGKRKGMMGVRKAKL